MTETDFGQNKGQNGMEVRTPSIHIKAGPQRIYVNGPCNLESLRRPDPEDRAPALVRLLDGGLPSGRYTAEHLLSEMVGA